jgi:immunity protein 53 of polymorphic toxin system
MQDEIAELQAWYRAQCNGDWEHTHGVTIGTLDNPGWSVTIDLIDTPLEDRGFSVVESLDHDVDWMRCEVKDLKWLGNGGPKMLRPILRTFLAWAKV